MSEQEPEPKGLHEFTADVAVALSNLVGYTDSMEEAVNGLTDDIGRLMELQGDEKFAAREDNDGSWLVTDYPFIAKAIKIYKEANS